MSDNNKCFFCNNECSLERIPSLCNSTLYGCSYCGDYLLDRLDSEDLSGKPDDRFKIACVLNERRLKKLGGIALSDKTDMKDEVLGLPQISVNDILNAFPSKASDFFNRALLNLSKLGNLPFDVISLDMSKDYVHLFTRHTLQGFAFLRELAEHGLIRFNEAQSGPQMDVFFLTTMFWETIENLQQTAIDSKRVFVAMWFDKSMDDYYKDGIKKAIEEAGYVPIRIDLKDFNEKICDEIIAEIRRAKFMIADCSEYRTAVFFEAGFAKGLGREVIFTVRKEDVDKLKEHFDTRQYNHIVYDSPEDLRKKLFNRIGATIV